MKGKNILSLSLILMFVTVMMMDIHTVQAAPNEYELYVDDFTGTWVEWNTYGISPYLNAPNDGSCIEGTFDGALIGLFTFENIRLTPCEVITEVVLEGFTSGPYNEDVDYDVYTFPDFDWLGSLYGKETPAWVTPRWVGSSASDIAPYLLTQSGLNSLEVLLYFFDPYAYGGNNNIVDALRLRVYTAISATIDICPNKIKLSNNAPHLTCYIELCPPFSASDINPSTVKLDGIPALTSPSPTIGDTIPKWTNGNGIPDLMVKFNMSDVKNHIVNDLLGGTLPSQPVAVTLTITGSLSSGEPFIGSDMILVKA